MRGYPGLAETLPPARVLPLLNEFFGVLARVTEAYGGEVFYMAGDGMMAGFGVRDPRQQGAREALGAGHTMQRRFSSLATRWQRDRSVVIGIGMGLHLGEVALGLLGPPGKGTSHWWGTRQTWLPDFVGAHVPASVVFEYGGRGAGCRC
jgi:class 3 adenylate cyclase